MHQQRELLSLLDSATTALNTAPALLARLPARSPAPAHVDCNARGEVIDASTNTMHWGGADAEARVARQTLLKARTAADAVAAESARHQDELEAMRVRLTSAEDGLDELVYQQQQDASRHSDSQSASASLVQSLRGDLDERRGKLEVAERTQTSAAATIAALELELTQMRTELRHADGLHSGVSGSLAAAERAQADADQQLAEMASVGDEAAGAALQRHEEQQVAHESALGTLQAQMATMETDHADAISSLRTTFSELRREQDQAQAQFTMQNEQAHASEMEALKVHVRSIEENHATAAETAASDLIDRHREQEEAYESALSAMQAEMRTVEKGHSVLMSEYKAQQRGLNQAEQAAAEALDRAAVAEDALSVQHAVSEAADQVGEQHRVEQAIEAKQIAQMAVHESESQKNELEILLNKLHTIEAECSSHISRAERAERAASDALNTATVAGDKLSAMEHALPAMQQALKEAVRETEMEATAEISALQTQLADAKTIIAGLQADCTSRTCKADQAEQAARQALDLAELAESRYSSSMSDEHQSCRARETKLEERIAELLVRAELGEAGAATANVARKQIEDELTSKIKELLCKIPVALNLAMKQDWSSPGHVDGRLSGETPHPPVPTPSLYHGTLCSVYLDACQRKQGAH